MGRLHASLSLFLIPGLGGFPLVWMQLQEHNICVFIGEKDRRRVIDRGKRDLSKDGSSCSCHLCHLLAAVWASGNRLPLGGGSASHASLQTAFGFLIWAAWCSWMYFQGRHHHPPATVTHSKCALDTGGGCVSAEVGTNTLGCRDQILLNSGLPFPTFQYLLLSRKGRFLS